MRHHLVKVGRRSVRRHRTGRVRVGAGDQRGRRSDQQLLGGRGGSVAPPRGSFVYG